jgi:Xaa-Pro aminopeptidase
MLIIQDVARGSRVGIDAAIVSFAESQNLTSLFEKANREVTLVPVKENLVDDIWSEQPSRPCNPIFRLDEKYTGASVSSKIRRLREQMAKSGSPGTVVSQLDEVAWLLNLRGSDIPYNPVSWSRCETAQLIPLGVLRLCHPDDERMCPLHKRWLH